MTIIVLRKNFLFLFTLLWIIGITNTVKATNYSRNEITSPTQETNILSVIPIDLQKPVNPSTLPNNPNIYVADAYPPAQFAVVNKKSLTQSALVVIHAGDTYFNNMAICSLKPSPLIQEEVHVLLSQVEGPALLATVNISTGEIINSLSLSHGAVDMDVSKDGEQIFIIYRKEKLLLIVSADNYQSSHQAILLSGDPSKLQVSPIDNLLLIFNPYNKTITVFNTATKTIAFEIPTRYSNSIATSHPGTNTIYTISSKEKELSLYTYLKESRMEKIFIGDIPTALTASPLEDRIFFSTGGAATIGSINTEFSTIQSVYQFPYSSPQSLLIDQDYKRLYVMGSDSSLYVIALQKF